MIELITINGYDISLGRSKVKEITNIGLSLKWVGVTADIMVVIVIGRERSLHLYPKRYL